MPRSRHEHRKNLGGEETKRCSSCRSWKVLQCFSKGSKCWDGLDPACKECNRLKYKNKQDLRKKQRVHAAKVQIASWLSANSQAIIDYSKLLRSDSGLVNEVEDRRWKTARRSEKYSARSQSTHDRIVQNLRARVRRVLCSKNSNAMNVHLPLIGCPPDRLKGWLEAQFCEGMNWDNFGNWHLDHVVPCSYFDMFEPCNQYRCFHYKNYQPVWKRDNEKKGTQLTPKAEKLLPFLDGLFPDIPLTKKSDEQEKLRKEKIAATLAAYNATKHGKDKKDEAHRKRSETMKARHYAPTSKRCRKCEQTLPSGEFGKRKASVDGLQSWCKPCTQQYKKDRHVGRNQA